MNTFKDYVIIHLQLIKIDVSEVEILLMTYPINFVFQANRRFKSKRYQDDYWSKWIENINKIYIMQILF